MATRKTPFVEGEFYHIYNRGVDKREIFSDVADLTRFFRSMEEFNTLEPIGSIYENSFAKNTQASSIFSHSTQFGHRMSKSGGIINLKLVNFICYCLNPNHFHFILEQVYERGIEKFMQRLGNGYTKYFNNKHKRSGVLFQGGFKSIHIDSNEYLLHLSTYVNLNDRVHQLGHPMSKLVRSRSSFGEYLGKNTENFCKKDIILDQFDDVVEYKTFAESSLQDIIERKSLKKELEELLLE